MKEITKEADLNAKPFDPISQYIQINSDEFAMFIKLLVTHSEDKSGKGCICLTCWEFINSIQMKKHGEMGHKCINP